MPSVSEFLLARKKKNPELRIGSLHEIYQTQKLPAIPTGNPVFDYVTSVGGIPRGVVTEIRGFASAGKTTAAAMAIAKHQAAVKAGTSTGTVLYLDFEYAVSAEYFSALGVDVSDEDTFVYMQPETLEEGMNEFLQWTKAGMLAMGVVDSVAAASSEAEYDKEVGKASIGLRARGFSQALRMAVGPMRVHGTSLILINHTQDSIPMAYGEISRKVSPGGKAMDYYTSLRIELERPKLNRDPAAFDELTNSKIKQVTSTEVTVTAFKNKVGVPHRTGQMRVEFGKGFDVTYSSFQILADHKYIKAKGGGVFAFPDELLPDEEVTIPRGTDNVIDLIKSIPSWQEKIDRVARALVLSKQVEQSEDEELILSAEIIDDETGEILNDGH